MTMKKKVLISLLIAAGLTLGSLLYRTGPSSIEPMPYAPAPGQVFNGVSAFCPTCFGNNPPVLARRGWPLPIVSLTLDEDEPSNYYRGLNVAGLLADFTLMFVLSFGVMLLATSPKKSR